MEAMTRPPRSDSKAQHVRSIHARLLDEKLKMNPGLRYSRCVSGNLRPMPEELHFTDVARVVLADEEIPFTVHRHCAIFADAKCFRVPEPGAVPGVRVRGAAIEEKVNVTVHVHIPYLAPAMGAEEVRARRQEPHAAYFVQACVRRQLPIAAAEGGDFASDVCLAPVIEAAPDGIPVPVCGNEVAPRIHHEIAEF